MPAILSFLPLLLSTLPIASSKSLSADNDILPFEPPLSQVLPNLFSYTWFYTFFEDHPSVDPAYSYSIAWNISNRGTANESFDYSLILTGPMDRSDPGCLEHAWMGIGFGISMVRNAEFNVCHMHELPIDGGPGGVRAHEHFTLSKYAPPLGLAIVSGVGFQFILGIFNALRLSNESIARVAQLVRLSHNLLGASLLIMSIAQIYLGLEHVNPASDASVPALWPIFKAIVATWIAAFAVIEIHFYLNVRRTDVGIGKLTESLVGSDVKRMYIAAKGVEVSSEALMTLKAEEERRTFTWQSLQDAIADGEHLVVGNGRFVYDISQWIRSHPGGQIILYAVAGTDISNDYFHEAGFDAGEFTPRPAIPPQDPNRTNATMLRNRPNRSFASSLPSIDSATARQHKDWLDSARATSNLTERDWKWIIRSRRTH
ncbi:hypothetical protein BDK51DRAFT_35348, partial [Blyttiomyces helicus]